MRKEYELSKEQLDGLMDACKPVTYMVFGGRPPSSPQENANRAWGNLGSEMGFEYMTVRPISGKDVSFFTVEETKAREEENAN